MKKTENEKLKSALIEIYDKEVPEPNTQILDTLISTTNQQKVKEKHSPKGFKRTILALACLIILLVPSILIPILLEKDAPPDEPYYSDDTLSQTRLTKDTTQELLLSHNAEYMFLLDECAYINSNAFYNDKNELIALTLKVEKNDIPFTSVYVVIAYSKFYDYKYHQDYINQAEKKEFSNVTLYENIIGEDFNIQYLRYFIYENYRVYLNLNIEDIDLIDKFFV